MKLFQASFFALLVAFCTCNDTQNDNGTCMVGLKRDRYSVVEGRPLEVCVVYVSGNCSSPFNLRLRMINQGAPSNCHLRGN